MTATPDKGSYVAPHVLVIEADADDEDDLTYRIECPHPPGAGPLPCATWEPCGCSMPTLADDEDWPDSAYDMAPCPRNPGLSHQYDGEFTSEICAPIGECWPGQYDDLDDVVRDHLGYVPPGRYPITYVCEDGTYLVPALAAKGTYERNTDD